LANNKISEFRGELYMNNFEFITGSNELLDLVQPLWEKLNQHHKTSSNYFSDRFKNFKYETRKDKFINGEKVGLKVDLIKDKENVLYIGYCISTINKDLIGEIDSLFIEKEYRKYGLGDKLMNRSLKWFNSNQVKTKIIGVAEGNENVLEFYKRYGFYEKSIILEQINK